MSELSAVKACFKVRSQKDNEAVDWVDFKLLNIEKLETLPVSIKVAAKKEYAKIKYKLSKIKLIILN